MSRHSIIRSSSMEEWEEEAQLPRKHVRTVYAIAWSKNSRRIASVGGDGRLVVYEERSGTEERNGTEEQTEARNEESNGTKDNTGWWEAIAEHDCTHGVFEVNHVEWAMSKYEGIAQEVLLTTGDDGNVNVWRVVGGEESKTEI
ncbi:MAG: hypothetical protein Q9183_007210 [Haloplaca sp. 2 TL-2023]